MKIKRFEIGDVITENTNETEIVILDVLRDGYVYRYKNANIEYHSKYNDNPLFTTHRKITNILV